MASQPALRRLPRPQKVSPCNHCFQATGRNYPTCPQCYEAIERFWMADWDFLLEQEMISPQSKDERILAQVVFDEGERHCWTLINVAMTFLRCPECASELGGGPADCTECASAWGVALWAEVVAGREGLVTANEHALHIGRMILRHRHRHSTNIIEAWSRTMPRLLVEWLPSTEEAQRAMALVKANRLDALDEQLAELDRVLNDEANKN